MHQGLQLHHLPLMPPSHLHWYHQLPLKAQSHHQQHHPLPMMDHHLHLLKNQEGWVQCHQ